MSEETTAETTETLWWAVVQEGRHAAGDEQWTQCCVSPNTSGSPVEVAQALLERHPDTATRQFRVLLWVNAERMGVVWTYTRTSASRFNPYTGETVDIDQLPFHELAAGGELTENPILTPAVQAAQDAADAETAAGLADAEDRLSLADVLEGNGCGGRVFVVTAEEELAAIANMRAEATPYGPTAQDMVKQALERQLIGSAVGLQNAITAAGRFAEDTGLERPWYMHEAALTSVSIAAAAYQAAFMYWKTYSR